MGIADSFKQLAERAKARMAPAEDDTATDDDAMMNDRYDNAARDRFGLHGDRARDALNERADEFTGRDNARDRDISGNDISDR